MKINEIISLFKGQLGAVGYEDNRVHSDEYWFNKLSTNMAIVVDRYKSKFAKLSDSMFSTYGVKLIPIGEDMFPCTDIEHCVVLESEYELPDALVGRNGLLLKVLNNKKELPPYNPANKYDDTLKNLPSWEIVNRKLRIHNNKTLKAITVRGLWHNDLDWIGKQYCNDTTPECLSLDKISSPLFADPKMREMCFSLTLQSMGYVLNQLNQPNSNQNQAH